MTGAPVKTSRWLWVVYTSTLAGRVLTGFADTGNGWWHIDNSLTPVNSPQYRRFTSGDFDFGRVLHATGQPVRHINLGTDELPDDIEPLWDRAAMWNPHIPAPEQRHGNRARWIRPDDIEACIAVAQSGHTFAVAAVN